MNYREILYNQLSKDFNLEKEKIKNSNNYFTINEKSDGRRLYEWDDCILKICSINNKFIMTSENKELLLILEKEFKDTFGGFIGRFDNLKKLNSILNTFGHEIADCHRYYIPEKSTTIESNVKTRIFEKDELLEFKGNPDFKNALEFSPLHPDMLGICSYAGNEISGMAAASKDSDTMWQIGVNVKEKYRKEGLGAFLTNKLKDEIIKRGVLPFYGMVESHINSQKIALKCGFIPAFWQLYTKEV